MNHAPNTILHSTKTSHTMISEPVVEAKPLLPALRMQRTSWMGRNYQDMNLAMIKTNNTNE